MKKEEYHDVLKEKIIDSGNLQDICNYLSSRQVDDKVVIDNFREKLLMPGSIDQYNSLWNEYKYRHESIWKLLFITIGACVTVSIIPYTKSAIVGNVGERFYDILFFIPIAILLYSAFMIWSEITLLNKIKDTFRDYQKNLFNIPHTACVLISFRARVVYFYALMLVIAVFHYINAPAYEQIEITEKYNKIIETVGKCENGNECFKKIKQIADQ